MADQKIRIRLKAYDHQVVDESSRKIAETVIRTQAKIKGPIPLPTRVERYTVLRSPHVDKKSRDQFEMRTHKRVIDIADATANTVNAITLVQMPAGVHITVKA